MHNAAMTNELFQTWRGGKIRRKDLLEEVVAMALDLCERWRAEQERCTGLTLSLRAPPHAAPFLGVGEGR